MKLTFLGAAHEVTGSCYLLTAAGKNFLVDYGMEQGKDILVNRELSIPASEIDFVLLTHAHIDHSGMLPALYAKGFRGPVYATDATVDLCDIMLQDSAGIQEFEAEWRNRKGKRSGREEYVPLFTTEDALGVIEQMHGMPYGEKKEIADGISVRFVDAGHLLGSASIEVWVKENGIEKKLVFSGDIGNLNQPIIKDPTYVDEADYVIMESTYGNRYHAEVVDYTTELAKVIQRTFDRGGNVVIPSFAVGRMQEILYFIREIKENAMVTGHGDFDVYVDSPLGIEATTIFQKHPYECYDREARMILEEGINPISFPGLHTAVTADESKAINFIETPKVIISASGMCDAGRVKHHLKHNLWRPESTILFVGYQAVGTPGRRIVDGCEKITMFGEEITVRAEVLQLPGVSGHADKDGLLRWAGAFKEKPDKVFVTHGEDAVTEEFAQVLRDELGYDAYAPYSGTVFDLAAGYILVEASPEYIDKGEKARKRNNTVYERLVSAGERLLRVIRRMEGYANKDLAKLADQITALCDKWEPKE